ncbi:MAG: histidine--tRNA ligase [Oscillospiraceae bacterium]|nr:histidine--tRNA ligase [Oscillospiraceae bacterium]
MITSPRGTSDVLPSDSYKWQFVESKLKEVCERFNYSETRTPTFEHTELFQRGVGDATDVVDKEMYTMQDKGGRSITLRPEGTAGVVRSFMQNGVLTGTLPVRSYYLLSCFRYEKPQAGRLREFHQLGIEMFGSPFPDADCEVIRVAKTALDELGIKKVRLELNSIGCPKCRPKYRQSLYNYFKQYEDQLCDTCKTRLEKNPMRILDCKSPICSGIAANAPVALDYLCEECHDHFEDVKRLLSEAGVSYFVNPSIVRGLDYYTKTVFEFVHEGAGAQGVVCGGGRYDGLVESLGGPSTPAIGFGMGIERLLIVAENEGIDFPLPSGPDLFIGYIGDLGESKTRSLVFQLQCNGVKAIYDINHRSLKAQMKYANKLRSKKMIVLGDDEVTSNSAILKDMFSGEEQTVDIDPARLAAAL